MTLLPDPAPLDKMNRNQLDAFIKAMAPESATLKSKKTTPFQLSVMLAIDDVERHSRHEASMTAWRAMSKAKRKEKILSVMRRIPMIFDIAFVRKIQRELRQEHAIDIGRNITRLRKRHPAYATVTAASFREFIPDLAKALQGGENPLPFALILHGLIVSDAETVLDVLAELHRDGKVQHHKGLFWWLPVKTGYEPAATFRFRRSKGKRYCNGKHLKIDRLTGDFLQALSEQETCTKDRRHKRRYNALLTQIESSGFTSAVARRIRTLLVSTEKRHFTAGADLRTLFPKQSVNVKYGRQHYDDRSPDLEEPEADENDD